jgi:hypothetical protein
MKGKAAFLSLLLLLAGGITPQVAVAQVAVFPAPSASPFPLGCVYNSVLPLVANGSTNKVECDANGRPLANGIATAPSPLPIVAGQYARTYRGGTITTGGTAQFWALAGVIAHGCVIQNTSSGIETIRMDGSAATAASMVLPANGGLYDCPVTAGPSASASIFGATTGQSFYAETW